MRIPFIGGSNKGRTVNVSAQRTVNMYAQLDPESKYQASLISRPGMTTFANAGASVNRGEIVFGDYLYVVVGNAVRKVDSSGVVSNVGTINTSTGRVSLSKNPTQILILDGQNGYIGNASSVTQIVDADFPNGATHGVYLDGYFIVNDPANVGRFNISAFNNGSSWGGTDFATATRNPDALEAPLVVNRQLWLLGTNTTEIWWNSGNPDFPFEATDTGFMNWGIAAPFSAVTAKSSSGQETAIWLSRNEEGQGVVMGSGGRLSNHAFEETIDGYSTISDAYAWVMQIKGHVFYVLTFPTAMATWVLNLSTGLWDEWKSYGLSRFRGAAYAFFDGKHIIGDYQDGTLFQMSHDYNQDAGSYLERIRQDRFIHVDRKWITHRRFELEVEAGVGSASLDPQLMLQWSDDGGHTWSNEHWRGLGKVGKYKSRAFWNQLGRSRDRIYRVTFTDNAPLTILAGHLEGEAGDA